ncbi:MAG: hypothetical protein KatS3mg111_0404 [Pirellulaceae bacterium]|nr:MAG: hypothetical protein KatS3mg111_0404 [Pirellulaceae bacterium]
MRHHISVRQRVVIVGDHGPQPTQQPRGGSTDQPTVTALGEQATPSRVNCAVHPETLNRANPSWQPLNNT